MCISFLNIYLYIQQLEKKFNKNLASSLVFRLNLRNIISYCHAAICIFFELFEIRKCFTFTPKIELQQFALV